MLTHQSSCPHAAAKFVPEADTDANNSNDNQQTTDNDEYHRRNHATAAAVAAAAFYLGRAAGLPA